VREREKARERRRKGERKGERERWCERGKERHTERAPRESEKSVRALARERGLSRELATFSVCMSFTTFQPRF